MPFWNGVKKVSTDSYPNINLKDDGADNFGYDKTNEMNRKNVEFEAGSGVNGVKKHNLMDCDDADFKNNFMSYDDEVGQKKLNFFGKVKNFITNNDKFDREVINPINPFKYNHDVQYNNDNLGKGNTGADNLNNIKLQQQRFEPYQSPERNFRNTQQTSQQFQSTQTSQQFQPQQGVPFQSSQTSQPQSNVQNLQSAQNSQTAHSRDNAQDYNQKYNFNILKTDNAFNADLLNVLSNSQINYDEKNSNSLNSFKNSLYEPNDRKILVLGCVVALVVFSCVIFLIYKNSSKIGESLVIKSDISSYKKRPENFDANVQEGQKIYNTLSGLQDAEGIEKIDDNREIFDTELPNENKSNAVAANEEIINSLVEGNDKTLVAMPEVRQTIGGQLVQGIGQSQKNANEQNINQYNVNKQNVNQKTFQNLADANKTVQQPRIQRVAKKNDEILNDELMDDLPYDDKNNSGGGLRLFPENSLKNTPKSLQKNKKFSLLSFVKNDLNAVTKGNAQPEKSINIAANLNHNSNDGGDNENVAEELNGNESQNSLIDESIESITHDSENFNDNAQNNQDMAIESSDQNDLNDQVSAVNDGVINAKAINVVNNLNENQAAANGRLYVQICIKNTREAAEDALDSLCGEYPLLKQIGVKISKVDFGMGRGMRYIFCIGPLCKKHAKKLVRNFKIHGKNTKIIHLA